MEIFSTIFGDSVIDLQSRVKIPKSMHWSVDLSDAQRIFTTDSVNRLMKGTEHEIKWHYTAPSMKQVYYFTKIFTIGMTVTIANINMRKWECYLPHWWFFFLNTTAFWKEIMKSCYKNILCFWLVLVLELAFHMKMQKNLKLKSMNIKITHMLLRKFL